MCPEVESFFPSLFQVTDVSLSLEKHVSTHQNGTEGACAEESIKSAEAGILANVDGEEAPAVKERKARQRKKKQKRSHLPQLREDCFQEGRMR